MAKTTPWQDDYWLPLMEVYLKKPTGMKPAYSPEMVALSLELHIAPHILVQRMKQLARLDTPRLERIWQTYGKNPQRLTRAVRLWREMKGFGAADEFYEGVEVNETFERDFRPLEEEPSLTPVALILILNLYYHLVPDTMVPQTPEVVAMARLLKVQPTMVVEVLRLYQMCDPYLNRNDVSLSSLLVPCQQVWQRISQLQPEQIEAFAEELKAFYQ